MTTFPVWVVESNSGYSVRKVNSALMLRVAETVDWPYRVYVFQTQQEADQFAASKGNKQAASAPAGQTRIRE